jgi:predicted transcriptional regulator YheO
MEEAEKKGLLDFLARLTRPLAEAIGKNCEVVLHDFSDPGKSIIAIENGHITGRKVGDAVDVFGLQLLQHPPSKDIINYRTETPDGKLLRSSSIFFRTETGDVFGSLCINYDISELVMLQQWLQRMVSPLEVGIQEGFEHTVEDVLDRLMQEAIRSTGKNISELTREDKIAVISYLETKGAFLIRYSVNQVAELLNLSKYTIYNYLEELKVRRAGVEESTAMHSSRGETAS